MSGNFIAILSNMIHICNYSQEKMRCPVIMNKLFRSDPFTTLQGEIFFSNKSINTKKEKPRWASPLNKQYLLVYLFDFLM